MKSKVISITLGLLLVVSTVSYGAMTCTESVTRKPGGWAITDSKQLLVLTCAADTTPATMTHTLSQKTMDKLDGCAIKTIVVWPGTTAPTDASDLAITDSRGLPLMTAAANGLDLVDATSTTQEYAQGPNGDDFQLIHSEYRLTFTITNQAVNNANVNIAVECEE